MPGDYSRNDEVELLGVPVNGTDRPAADLADEIRRVAREVAPSVAGDTWLVDEFRQLTAEEEKYLASQVLSEADEVFTAENLIPEERAEASLVHDAWVHWARGHLRRLRALQLLAMDRVEA